MSSAVAERKYYLCENAAPKPVQFAELRNLVQGNVSQAALGTELPQMLEGILNRPKATEEVSVIISDFIYGPEDRSAFSQLPNLIRTAIAPVSRQQLAVAVFGEASKFYGTYHPAVKTPQPKRTLSGEKIPYYVWVIGPPAQVARFTAEVFRNAPAQQAFYGLKLPKPGFAPVLTKLSDPKLKPSGGTVFAEGEGLSADVSDDPVDFSVGMNLADLPAAWQQPAFLAQNLQVRLPNGQAALQPNSLRLLTDTRRGGIVAAATTSLPEEFGGTRNWDYRYVWLRDASLTLHVLLDHGYVAEADDWRNWLLRAIAGDPDDVQIMYGLSGERRLDESELASLPGYDGAGPVRIGNGAENQLQMDIYGEAMNSIAEADAQEEFRRAAPDKLPGLTGDKLEAYIGRHYAAYWLKVDLATKIEHARFLLAAEAEAK